MKEIVEDVVSICLKKIVCAYSQDSTLSHQFSAIARNPLYSVGGTMSERNKQASNQARLQTPSQNKEIGATKKGNKKPYKCTDSSREKILHALELGASFQSAAAAGGISYSTLAFWRSEDSTFAEACEAARGLMELRNLQRIDAAAEESWQAAGWLLERRRPEDYGRKFQPMPMVKEQPTQEDAPGKVYRIMIEPLDAQEQATSR